MALQLGWSHPGGLAWVKAVGARLRGWEFGLAPGSEASDDVRGDTGRNQAGRFRKGVSGNPAGRPKGLVAAARAAVGEDGRELIAFWREVMRGDHGASLRDRLEASKLLADRGFGKAPLTAPVESEDRSSEDGMPTVPELDRMIELLTKRMSDAAQDRDGGV